VAQPVVVRVAGPSATLLIGDREVEAPIAPRLPGGPLVVGDRVDIREAGDDVVVVGIKPRSTQLQRVTGTATRPRPRIVVANADVLLVIASVVEPTLRPWMVDRYLVASHVGGLEPAIVFTKTDLPHDAGELAASVALYRAVGYTVITGSAKSAELVHQVRQLVDGRVAALAGESGVGKSTMVRGLTGLSRAVGEVSERARTGRHTTTDPRLMPLLGGGSIIDTAGVRSFYLPPLEREEVVASFPEIAAAANDCRFDDCRHSGDAGCAVPGRVSPERLESFRRILASVESGRGFIA
jgi:ribosome biogenesis GTPase / thiamine phosphate phosphatase